MSVLLLLHFPAVEVGVELRLALLLGEMLEAQALHHLVQGDGVEALDDLQAAPGGQLHGLLFEALEEIALNASDVDGPERADLILPIHDTILLSP